ncbi:hypothetical protein BC830DRAFT_415967 [Chytriomyces sp. MP71]|nr:hypothetical protein BC830DRAFT_415967 [Chytriomyces sp. MP71]
MAPKPSPPQFRQRKTSLGLPPPSPHIRSLSAPRDRLCARICTRVVLLAALCIVGSLLLSLFSSLLRGPKHAPASPYHNASERLDFKCPANASYENYLNHTDLKTENEVLKWMGIRMGFDVEVDGVDYRNIQWVPFVPDDADEDSKNDEEENEANGAKGDGVGDAEVLPNDNEGKEQGSRKLPLSSKDASNGLAESKKKKVDSRKALVDGGVASSENAADPEAAGNVLEKSIVKMGPRTKPKQAVKYVKIDANAQKVGFNGHELGKDGGYGAKIVKRDDREKKIMEWHGFGDVAADEENSENAWRDNAKDWQQIRRISWDVIKPSGPVNILNSSAVVMEPFKPEGRLRLHATAIPTYSMR